MKRVVIVEEGRWGDVRPEDYRDLIEIYRRTLDEAEVPNPYGHGKEKAARVDIVATIAETEAKIKHERVDVVVFVSRGVEREAERLAKTYPKTRIVVFTGLIPEGKVLWVGKAYCATSEMIENVVLHS